MSQENVAKVRASLDAWNRGDYVFEFEDGARARARAYFDQQEAWARSSGPGSAAA